MAREHVAIVDRRVVEPLRAGLKRIETRFYRHRRAPLGRVAAGDRIHFKVSGGPFIGVSEVRAVHELADLEPAKLRSIRRIHKSSVRAPGQYWLDRENSRYGVLIWLGPLGPPAPGLRIPRQYGGAWVVLGAGPSRADKVPT